MAWIKTVSDTEAAGLLKQIYSDAVKRAGRVYNIVKLQSLNPETLKASLGLYMSTMFLHSSITRAQREMIATVVSWANKCHY